MVLQTVNKRSKLIESSVNEIRIKVVLHSGERTFSTLLTQVSALLSAELLQKIIQD